MWPSLIHLSLNKCATERASTLLRDTQRMSWRPCQGRAISWFPEQWLFAKPRSRSCFFPSRGNWENIFCSHFPDPLIPLRFLPVSKHTAYVCIWPGCTPSCKCWQVPPIPGRPTPAPPCFTKASRGVWPHTAGTISHCAGQTWAQRGGRADRFVVLMGYIWEMLNQQCLEIQASSQV